jgi:CubicO group peptidase (beta-lactamase class C family)
MTVSMSRAEAGALSARNLEYLDEHLQKRYIDAGKLTGALTAIYRKGHLAHWSVQGLADRENGTPLRDDTIFRIYSMTKPIVSVALMQLYERGLMQIDDPVERYIPSWKNLRVYQSGIYPNFITTPCIRPMTVRDLLSHQSGLTYGNVQRTNVDAAYRTLGIGREGNATLQEMIDKLAEIPLEFSPGTAWNYSHSTDVVGYLVEVISGQRLDAYLQEHIFEPLGMVDTGFWVPPSKADRLSSNYHTDPNGGIKVWDAATSSTYLKEPTFLSGGGGGVSTADDYLRFSRMLLAGGQLEGTRIIGRKTLQLMARNHITGNRTMAQAVASGVAQASYPGNGFGLGFAVALDTADGQISGSAGEHNWSGAASTHFWIDPAEEMAVVFMTQYMSQSPANRYNLSRELRAIIYGALD